MANVDPIDFARATEGLNPEETLVIINSKTFGTAETLLNAKTVKQWLVQYYQGTLGMNCADFSVVKAHMCAASTNLQKTRDFGISDDKVFGFWDWVGGRFSVTSVIGVLPLSLIFSNEYVREFLDGAHEMDKHFRETKDLTKNIPVMMGLIGFYNSTIQGYSSRSLVPYCQALSKFGPHIQQVDMESNGKGVTLDGKKCEFETGVVNFGEPGTNSQHSFFQLLHQGRVIPVEFIGYCKSCQPFELQYVEGSIPNHDELMSNFFAQPDALALGCNAEELRAKGVSESLIPHKTFTGDRPSSSLLFNELNPRNMGRLLAIYEHRTAVEGFIWDINSFDQMGVELGKALANKVRDVLKTNIADKTTTPAEDCGFNRSITNQLEFYLKHR